MVAHLHFFPTHKSTLKNAKELPSQRTTTRQQNGQTSKTEKRAADNRGLAKVGRVEIIEYLEFYLAFVQN